MDERIKRSVFLNGVLIGIYGNWLIVIFQEVAIEYDFATFLLFTSLIPFYFFLRQLFKEDVHRRVKTKKFFLLLAHYFLILGAYTINSGLINLNIPFISFGIIIGYLFMQVDWNP